MLDHVTVRQEIAIEPSGLVGGPSGGIFVHIFMPHAANFSAGKYRRTLRIGALGLGVLAIVLAIGWQMLWRQHVKRFQVVRPGVLYRVAQPSEWGLRYLVRSHGVKTVLNLRLEDDPLRHGLLAVGAPRGPIESRFVADLGMQSVQWPMGREACWPWVSPWQFEEFYRLFDDPNQLPVAIHCVSGRHRTGTIAALFRLEYDRWPIERVLAEMYSFSFGPPILLQEMNLRTYVPRPQPTDEEWQTLRNHWSTLEAEPIVSQDYADLIRQLRTSSDPRQVRGLLTRNLEQGRTFALPVAVRLIDDATDSACAPATAAALACIQRSVSVDAESAKGALTTSPESQCNPGPADLMAAAALIADFGTAEQQSILCEYLRSARNDQVVTPAFAAIAAGVANRYTSTRIPFLAILLEEERILPETGRLAIRYCDMAVARLSAIVDQQLIRGGPQPTVAEWDQARAAAQAWLATHPQPAELSRLQPQTAPSRR